MVVITIKTELLSVTKSAVGIGLLYQSVLRKSILLT